MIAGVETGGTKVVCAVAERSGPILDRRTFPTADPDPTLRTIADFLAQAGGEANLEAIGVGTFGPVDLNPDSPDHGVIGHTPKQGWTGARVKESLEQQVGAPVAIDTDVNAAALAEARFGAAQGLDPVVYVTVGTGVGVGGVLGGRTLRGYAGAHPELGHLPVRRHTNDAFEGNCRVHGDCLEGMAAGPALAARWGPAETRGPAQDDLVADLAGYYLAQLVVTVTYALSPGCVVLGGGVSKSPGLTERTREHCVGLDAGYLGEHPLSRVTSDYLRPPAFEDEAGVLGALTLARDLLKARDG